MNKISIIIPCYNGEKYLAECIDSAITQTYDDKEIIVVDDGSTDNSRQIANEYMRDHPRLITVYTKSNGGTASALNFGIKASNGQWIKWLSADDILYPGALKNMMDFIVGFSSKRNPTEYIYYTDYDIINEKGEIKRLFEEPNRTQLTRKQSAAEMFRNFYGNGSSTIINKQMFNIVGKFAEGMPYNDDYEFWLRWNLQYDLGMQHIPIITLLYREHSESLTGKKSAADNLKLVEELRSKYSQYLTEDQKEYLKANKDKFSRRLGKKLPGPILNGLMRLKK